MIKPWVWLIGSLGTRTELLRSGTRWVLAASVPERGIENEVVDSSSIEVSRRLRRAKTDRLDADRLLAKLMRYHAGEREG